MPKQKKNSKGYYVKYFTHDGKTYKVYGKDQKELLEKVTKKQRELEEGQLSLQNPTLDAYYEQFTQIRRREIEESTIRAVLPPTPETVRRSKNKLRSLRLIKP